MKKFDQRQSAPSTEDIATLAAQEWRAYIDPLGAIGEKMVARMSNPQDPQLRRELYSTLFSQTATAYLGLLYADSRHPDFWPVLNVAFNGIGPNPDDAYYLTPIDDDGVYKLSGFRGTVKIVNFQIGTGVFPITASFLADYDLDSLPLNSDGSFEVVLSANRPAGYEGNWWKLFPKATYLVARQVAYDWLNEVDGRFAIERLDRPAVKPRPSAAELEEKLNQVAKWVEDNMNFCFDYIKTISSKMGIKANQVGYKDYFTNGDIETQRYSYVLLDLQPDEALILETEVPERCLYWSFHFFDDLLVSTDWMNRQTSLNGYTARIDTDGKFRAVISALDPGVPNWLDIADYQTGVIAGRWKDCSSLPSHKTTKIKIAEVRNYLPVDTPVITAEERDAAIRLRRKAAQLRRRW